MEKVIVYPGSFDPITYGHINIIQRLSTKFDKVVVLVAYSKDKQGFFTVKERCELIKSSIDLQNVEVDSWHGLLVEYMKSHNYSVIGKGLRSAKDFQYELEMAHVNKKLFPQLETLFLLSDAELSYISSSLVKEVAMHGGDVSAFVPQNVIESIQKKN